MTTIKAKRPRQRKLKLDDEPGRWTERGISGAEYLALCARQRRGEIWISQVGVATHGGVWNVRWHQEVKIANLASDVRAIRKAADRWGAWPGWPKKTVDAG